MSLKIERRDANRRNMTLAVPFELKAIDAAGTIEGYGSIFGVRDSYDDVVAKGAFVESLARHRAEGTMPAMLKQHNPDWPIGVWDEMEEDARGLRVKGRLALDTEAGAEMRSLLALGAIKGLSIGFVTNEYAWDRENEVRTLTKVDLWELSLVTFPANRLACVDSVKTSLREVKTPKDAERILREADFSKAEATGLVSCLLRMGSERREAATQLAAAQKSAEALLETLKKGL